MKTTTVYVRLLDEGTDVFRPTQAECLQADEYRLLPTADYDPEDEHWEFLPHEAVKCEWMKLYGGERLVAVSTTREQRNKREQRANNGERRGRR